MDSETRNSATDAAVMESLAENQFVREYCNSHPGKDISLGEILNAYKGSTDMDVRADMQILSDYVNNQNTEAANYVIKDYHTFGSGDGYGHSVLVSTNRSEGPNDVWVAYDGTDHYEWKDNGEGMYSIVTPQQQAACDQFDRYVNEFGLSIDDTIVITGHSKGGNKAMYTTMSSEYAEMIDQCIAYDAQGFSPEAIDAWHDEYSDSEYNNLTDKITLISGSNDFVHELGIPIAGHSYTIGYQAWAFDELGDIPASWHKHQNMFGFDSNGQLVLNGDAKPGFQEGCLNAFMSEYMKLDIEERARSAPEMMELIQQLFYGDAVENNAELVSKINDVLLTISETSNGRALVRLLAAFLCRLVAPNMYLIGMISAYAAYLLLGGRLKYKPQEGADGKDTISVPNDILLNVETFKEMKSSFDKVFSDALQGARYAVGAEKIQQDSNTCDALIKVVEQKSEDITQIMVIIVESFSAIDNENAKAARNIGESYLGADVYAIASER